MPSLPVKVYRDNEIRRCRLETGDEEGRFGYQRLVVKIRQLFSDLETKNVRLMWKDSDGEFVLIASISDFKEAVANLPADDPVLRVYVFESEKSDVQQAAPIDEEPKNQPMEQVQQQQTKEPDVEPKPREDAQRAEAEADPDLHRHVVCDGCEGEIRGIRYKCLTCPDYDLCSTCMNEKGHDEHPTLRITSPKDDSWKEAFLASQAFDFFIPKNFCHGRRQCHHGGQSGCHRGQQGGCPHRAADQETNDKAEEPKKQSDETPLFDEEMMRNLTGALETVFNIFGVPVATSGAPQQQEPAPSNGEPKSSGSIDAKIEAALNYMLAMGYRNDCGHLKALLEKYRGDVSAVIDRLNQL